MSGIYDDVAGVTFQRIRRLMVKGCADDGEYHAYAGRAVMSVENDAADC